MQPIILEKKAFCDMYGRMYDYETRLDTLAFFLSTDSWKLPDYYISWLKANMYVHCSIIGHWCTMTFDGKNVILDANSNPNPEDTSQAFIASKEKLIIILERWKEIMTINPLPNKIIFTQDENGTVIINTQS